LKHCSGGKFGRNAIACCLPEGNQPGAILIKRHEFPCILIDFRRGYQYAGRIVDDLTKATGKIARDWNDFACHGLQNAERQAFIVRRKEEHVLLAKKILHCVVPEFSSEPHTPWDKLLLELLSYWTVPSDRPGSGNISIGDTSVDLREEVGSFVFAAKPSQIEDSKRSIDVGSSNPINWWNWNPQMSKFYTSRGKNLPSFELLLNLLRNRGHTIQPWRIGFDHETPLRIALVSYSDAFNTRGGIAERLK
jgi:hypothetical protein